jgi:hypothetical protein
MISVKKLQDDVNGWDLARCKQVYKDIKNGTLGVSEEIKGTYHAIFTKRIQQLLSVEQVLEVAPAAAAYSGP